MDLLKYRAIFPTVPEGTDITQQQFTVTANGTAQEPQILDASAPSAEFEVEQGAAVTLSLVYIDDGGNKSAERATSFTAQDTIPPQAPEGFGPIELIGERVVPDQPPTP